MASRKAKTIKMLLYDGSLDGVTNISDSAWDSGKMYSAPRESINSLISHADCKKYGVYLLLSENQVYVGQAIDLERRTKQHLSDKVWWNQVVLMTTKDDSFNASDIDYLEARLIGLAGKAATSDSDNKKKGNRQKVDEFRQAELEQYLEEALFLLELIGVRIFKDLLNTGNKQSSEKQKKKRKAIGMNRNNNTDINKPSLPDETLGPCVFVKTAFKNLLASGYEFNDNQISSFSTVEGSKSITSRNLPLFWLLNNNENRSTCDKNIRSRYWKDEFVSGKYRFLLFSQWYDNPNKGATNQMFIEWYNSL